jgi:hypothetical protein
LNSVEQKAMNEEIGRQVREFTNNLALELDASILWALHEEFGFGKERLKRFYQTAAESREQLIQKYEMQDDAKFICMHKLKEIGVDLVEWEKQLQNHIKIKVG